MRWSCFSLLADFSAHSLKFTFLCLKIRKLSDSLFVCNFTVKNLSSTIPSLLDKINKIEELSLQAGPISNVSENIKRIKELIEQARDAANRVRLRILKMWVN